MKFVLTALRLGALLALANYWVLWNLARDAGCVACAAIASRRTVRVRAGGGPRRARLRAGRRARGRRRSRPRRGFVNRAARAPPRQPSLQEEGRLVDFLTEEIAGYTDEQIGAATRGIHDACSKALRACVTLEPVLPGHEDDAVTVPANFDPASVRLTGNVHGNPPFTGTLRHGGWRVKSITIPARTGLDPKIVAPAEVEIA
jgi:hypothetical protein